jgi:hypothetical protein
MPHYCRNSLPEPDGDVIANDLAHDAATIAESLAACLPPPNVEETTEIFDSHMSDIAFLDMDELVKIRFAHQTKQALTGVRTNVKAVDATLSSGKQKQSHKQHVQTQLNRIIKGLDERGVGSGLGRAVRWQNSKTGDSARSAVLTGNAANAVQAANTQAKTVCHGSSFKLRYSHHFYSYYCRERMLSKKKISLLSCIMHV